MKWARALWNGPFWIGPLTRPVTVGDALMKLFEVVWRAILIVLFAGIILALGLWGFVIIGAWWSPPLGQQLETRAWYDTKSCPAGYPVKVEITNSSTRTVGEVRFRIEVRRLGRSTDLNQLGDSMATDGVLQPQYVGQYCFPASNLPEGEDPTQLLYAADVLYATEYKGPAVAPPPIMKNR